MTVAPARPLSTPAIGTQLAQAGLRAMFDPTIRNVQDQVQIGFSYDQNIASQSTDPTEEAVAKAALSACTNVAYARAQVGVLAAAFNSIAGGVIGGPIGTTLAHAAIGAMYNNNVTYIRDQAGIGLEFAVALRDNTTDATQKALADTAIQAASHVSTARSQVDILGNFFSQVQ